MRVVSVLFALGLVVFTVGACTKEEATPAASTASAEYTSVSKVKSATVSAGTNSNGISKGSGYTISSLVGGGAASLLAGFSPETDCATTGWPASGTNGDVGYAIRFLLCSVLKSPDGPDTVRGGFDRITGLLCAAGNVTYDGTARSVTMTFSTACFTQTFVTTACTTILGTSSTGPCSASATITGYSSVTGVAPSSFDKYLTISLLSGQVVYSVAHKITSTSIAGAAMDGLPSAADGDIEDAFAFYLDASSGTLRYEGRFPGSNKRHMRIVLIGSIATDFTISNVETLRFVQGENFDGSSGLIVSVNGTPSAGRRLRIQSTSNMSAGTPTWGAANADDNTCIGEAGALCTSNTGIVASDKKFFFASGSGFTSSKTWFTSNSYLGGVSDTVDMDDLWD